MTRNDKILRYEDFNFNEDEKLFDDTEDEISETQEQNEWPKYSQKKSLHSTEALIRLLRIIFREVDEREKHREDLKN